MLAFFKNKLTLLVLSIILQNLLLYGLLGGPYIVLAHFSKLFGISSPIFASILIGLAEIGFAIASYSWMEKLQQKAAPWIEQSVEGFKYTVVNTLPNRVFFTLASFFPIGDWIVLEEPDFLWNNALLRAVNAGDEALVDKILNTISKKTLYEKFLLAKHPDDFNPIRDLVIAIHPKHHILKKLILAIEPHERARILKLISENEVPVVDYMFYDLAMEMVDFIMNTIPENDRWGFIFHRNEDGKTPLELIVSLRANLERVKALLNFVPQDKLIDYLNNKNNFGLTTLVYAACNRDAAVLRFILELVPQDKLQAFFDYEGQGVLALKYAKAWWDSRLDKDSSIKAPTLSVLESYGLKVPEAEMTVSLADLREVEKFAFAEAGFKEKYGESPKDILELENHDPDKIKKAYYKQMLKHHPDKNGDSPEANERSKKILAAKEFYTNKE